MTRTPHRVWTHAADTFYGHLRAEGLKPSIPSVIPDPSSPAPYAAQTALSAHRVRFWPSCLDFGEDGIRDRRTYQMFDNCLIGEPSLHILNPFCVPLSGLLWLKDAHPPIAGKPSNHFFALSHARLNRIPFYSQMTVTWQCKLL